MRYITFLPLFLLLTACGPSQEEKQNTAIITCNIMGESRNMDASIRIREINTARDKIGEKPYLFGDDKIKESFEYGLCEALVLNNKYETRLRIAKQLLQVREANEAQLTFCKKQNKEFLNKNYLRYGIEDIRESSQNYIERIYSLTSLEDDLKRSINLLDKNFSDLEDSIKTEYENTANVVKALNEKIKEEYEILNDENTEQIYGETYKCNMTDTINEYKKKKSILEAEILKIPREIIFYEEKQKEAEAESARKQKEAEAERARKQKEAEEKKLRRNRLLKEALRGISNGDVPKEINNYEILSVTNGGGIIKINEGDVQILKLGDTLKVDGIRSPYFLSDTVPSVKALIFIDLSMGSDFALANP